MKHPQWILKFIHKSKVSAVKIVNWDDHHEIATIPNAFTFNGEDSEGMKAAKLMVKSPELLDALKKADQRITELCATVNTLAGFRKVRAEDYAEEIRSAIAEVEA